MIKPIFSAGEAILESFPLLREKGVTEDDATDISLILQNTLALLSLLEDGKVRISDIATKKEEWNKFLEKDFLLSEEDKKRIKKSLNFRIEQIRYYFLKRGECLDTANKRLLGEGIINNRENKKGYPIIRKDVIPRLYDILSPYFKTESRIYKGTEALYPQKLITFIVALIKDTLSIDIKEDDVKSQIDYRYKPEHRKRHQEYLKKEKQKVNAQNHIFPIKPFT